MEARQIQTEILAFGPFEVNLRTAELSRNGRTVRLPAQSFQVLRLLIQQPGELIPRHVLQEALWPGSAYGDLDHGLNAAVNRLREALGDSAGDPRYIETLSRRGYRFIATLRTENVPHHHPASPEPIAPVVVDGFTAPGLPAPVAVQEVEHSEAGSQPRGSRSTSLAPRLLWLVVLVAVCTVSLALLKRLDAHQQQDPAASNASGLLYSNVSVAPLTALPGLEYAAAFSPDASHVAFAWNGGRSAVIEPFDLYVKVIGSERLEQLTHHPAAWLVPAWSPDGRTIAFARSGKDDSGIFLVSALGGPERKLADATFDYVLPMSLSWSADGRTLLYASRAGLMTVDADSGQSASVAVSPSCRQPLAPAFSHDGKWIAFSCYLDLNYELYAMPAHGGAAKPLALVNEIPLPLAWSADDTAILYSAHGALFSVARSGGKARLLTFAHDALQPAVSTHGERLAYTEWTRNINLWRLELPAGTAAIMAATSREQRAASVAPDGQHVAFESLRSGSREVWMSRLDGSEAVQLSNLHSMTGSPRWSPDGSAIVFDSREPGKAALYLVDPETRVPRRVDTQGLPASVPTWSRDGAWIYFHGGAQSQVGLYKVSPKGGTARLVIPGEVYNAQEAKAAPALYFMAGEAEGTIQVLNQSTGVMQALPGMPIIQSPTDWVVSSRGIYFVQATTSPATLCFYDFARSRVTRRMPLPRPPDFWGGIDISPDERWLVYAQVDQDESDIMLAEGIR